MLCLKQGYTTDGNAGICLGKKDHPDACFFHPRFHKTKGVDKGTNIIADWANTEPVCKVWEHYHPGVTEIILRALKEAWEHEYLVEP